MINQKSLIQQFVQNNRTIKLCPTVCSVPYFSEMMLYAKQRGMLVVAWKL